MAQINKPSDYFNTLLYTSNNTTDTSITGVGFQPDLIWFKNRSSAYDHRACDSVRGANKLLGINITNAEATTTDSVISIDSDGFTLGADNAGYGVNYPNSNNIVAWNWLASNTTASNTDGSITSTVSANTTSGFSIVSYTGTGANATVGHGLGTTPACILSKNRNDADNWNFWHQNLSATSGKYMTFNDTGAEQTDSTIWNTAPTSTVFGIGTNNRINGSSDGMIAYCFAEKKGFSKAFSYTGNGSTDGSFVFCGFKPAFVIIKRTDAVNSWVMLDNKRPSYNNTNQYLLAESSGAELTDMGFDILSNGFKLRQNYGSINASGGTYIGLAFAESPLVGTNNTPATAR